MVSSPFLIGLTVLETVTVIALVTSLSNLSNGRTGVVRRIE